MSEEPSKPKSVRPTAAGTGPREDVRTKGAKNGDRRAYFAQRRAGIRGRALRTVAAYHNRPVECFRCGGSKDLELDHVYYAKDSEKYGHSAERAEEALKFPSRFILTCRPCHIKYDLQNQVGPNQLYARAGVGSEVRARETLLKSRSLGKLKDERDRAIKLSGQILDSWLKAKEAWENDRQELIHKLEEAGIEY